MTALIHPARKCTNCAHADPEDGCLNGLPSDAVSCTEHQTDTEFEFFIHLAERAPVMSDFHSSAVQ